MFTFKSFIINFLSDRKLYKYLGTGAAAACVDFGLFMLLVATTHGHYLILNTISFVAATLVNYWLCANVVFDHPTRYSPSLTLVLTFMVSLVGLGLQTSAVWTAVEMLALPLAFAKILAMGSSFLWNFCSRKFWVFSKRPVTT